MKKLSLCLIAFCGLAAAQVSINTNLVTGQMTGSVADIYRTAYLHFQLVNCGDNVPVLQGQGTAVVQDSFDLRPATPGSAIVGNILGNDQMSCGNILSTYYLVTPMKDASHPLRDGVPYVICSASAALTTCGNSSSLGAFDITSANVMTQPPPTPGFVQLFGNPTNNQTWNQPTGTTGNFVGSFDFENGIFIGSTTFAGLSSVFPFSNFIYVTDGTFGSSPCSGGGTGAFAFYISSANAWTCSGGGGGGGGSGTVNAGTAGCAAYYVTGLAAVSAGCEIVISGNNVLVPLGSFTVGASALGGCGTGVVGCGAQQQGSTPGTPTAGQNYFRATSTGWMCAIGTGAEFPCLASNGGYVDLSSNQSGIGGSKAWTGAQGISNTLSVVNAGIFTGTQQNNNATSAVGGINPLTWYAGVPVSLFTTDAGGFGAAIPSSALIHQVDAVAGYVTSTCAGAGSYCNGVAGYFQNMALANNVWAWGINTNIQDAVGITGAVLTNEFDTNILGSPTAVAALEFNGLISGTLPAAIPVGSLTGGIDAAFIDFYGPHGMPLGINFRPRSLSAGATAIQIQYPCLTGSCSSNLLTFTGFNGSTTETAAINADSGGDLVLTPASGQLVSAQGALAATGAISSSSTVSGTQLASTIAAGTAPMTVATNNATRITYMTTGGNPVITACGSTTACTASQDQAGYVAHGSIGLTGGTATITGLPFSTTAWICLTNDTTNVANGSKMQEASSSTATVTGSGTDNIVYVCFGK